MRVKTTCPHCQGLSMVAEELRGKTVRCPRCKGTFSVPVASVPVLELAEDSAPQPQRHGIQDKPRPAAASAAAAPPRRTDDTPAARNKTGPTAKAGSSTLLLVLAGGGVAALLLLAVVVAGGLWWWWSFRSTPPSDLAAVNGPGDAAVAQAPDGNGANPAPANQSLRYRWQGGPHVYAVSIEAEQDNYFDIHSGNCILTVQKADRPRNPGDLEERKGNGTGFVVNANGCVVTCDHVVANATKIEVVLGERTYPATVLARDPEHDLAVIRVNAQNLAALSLADSDRAEVGQEVRALGFPLSNVLGENLKATRGTIAGVNLKDGKKLFQVDAAINPGNSGGPLVSESGLVLGVNSAKLAGDAISNVGFTTPSNDVKQLLRSRGVAFSTDGWRDKLDGPTLVKRVSAAVALVRVTVAPGVDPDTWKVGYRGHLVRHQRAKPGVILMPGPPGFSFGRPGPNEVDMDGSGRILNVTGGISLPMLLGDLAMFLIEPLPQDNRSEWETSGTCTITESNDGFGGRPFGPHGPRMPFGPRGPFGGEVNIRTREGKEQAVYKRGVRVGNTLTIHKHYELKVPAAAGSEALELSGDKESTFDLQAGMPQGILFKGALLVGARRTPLSVTYRLLTGDDRERVLNPPPPPKVEPRPIAEADLPALLETLKTGDWGGRQKALKQLAEAKLDPTRREEVARALVDLLNAENNQFTRTDCLKALAVWGGRDNVPALLPYLNDSNVFIRGAAVAALGKTQDERAAKPIAKLLVDLGDRRTASEALQAIGPRAEKVVLPYVTHRDWGVRLAACQILKVIGTRECKAALETASQDDNGLVAREARLALNAVAGRP